MDHPILVALAGSLSLIFGLVAVSLLRRRVLKPRRSEQRGPSSGSDRSAQLQFRPLISYANPVQLLSAALVVISLILALAYSSW